MYFLALVQCFDNSLPSADSPWIRVRRFRRYYQVAVTSHAPFRVLEFPLGGDTPCCAISVSRRSHTLIELLWSPGLIREFMERGGTSQVSVRPPLSVRTCCSDPGRITTPDHKERSMLFHLRVTDETPAIIAFRDSITRHSDWLFTLRGTVSGGGRSRIHRRLLAPTQNSLPAVVSLTGWAHPTRFSKRCSSC